MTEGCELPLHNAPPEQVKQLLRSHRVVAVVGVSAKEDRDSNRVARYLMRSGYRVVPVNPAYEEVLGTKCFRSLEDIPFGVDIVDIFRKPEAVPEIVEQAIRKGAKAVWMQEGIVDNKSAARARQAGLSVVMNRCMMKEHMRLA